MSSQQKALQEFLQRKKIQSSFTAGASVDNLAKPAPMSLADLAKSSTVGTDVASPPCSLPSSPAKRSKLSTPSGSPSKRVRIGNPGGSPAKKSNLGTPEIKEVRSSPTTISLKDQFSEDEDDFDFLASTIPAEKSKHSESDSPEKAEKDSLKESIELADLSDSDEMSNTQIPDTSDAPNQPAEAQSTTSGISMEEDTQNGVQVSDIEPTSHHTDSQSSCVHQEAVPTGEDAPEGSESGRSVPFTRDVSVQDVSTSGMSASDQEDADDSVEEVSESFSENAKSQDDGDTPMNDCVDGNPDTEEVVAHIVGVDANQAKRIVFGDLDNLDENISQLEEEGSKYGKNLRKLYPELLRDASIPANAREAVENFPSVLASMHVPCSSLWVKGIDVNECSAVVDPPPTKLAPLTTGKIFVPILEFQWWLESCRVFFHEEEVRARWIRNEEVTGQQCSLFRVYDAVRAVHAENCRVLLRKFAGTPAVHLLRAASEATICLRGQPVKPGRYTSAFSGQSITTAVPLILGTAGPELGTAVDNRRVWLVEPEYARIVLAFSAYVNLLDRFEREAASDFFERAQPEGPHQRLEQAQFNRILGSIYVYYTNKMVAVCHSK